MKSSEWKNCTLGEVVKFNYGKSLPKARRVSGEIPVYSSSGITGWHNKPLVQDEGIIIGRKGTVGTVYYSKKPFYCIDTAYYLTANDTTEDLKFIYYLLKYLPLSKLDTDSAVPGLNRQYAYSQLIHIPKISIQKTIAHILSTIDWKIKTNNKINQNLEAMAQAIFKHWFVDFEFPNENGEPYKSSGGEMVESELGMIPRGWRLTSLDCIARFINGLAMQKFRPKDNENGIPVLKIKELRNGLVTNESDKCTSDLNEDYLVNNGDVIFSWSGSLLVKIWCGGKCGLNQHLFKVVSCKYAKWFYYHWTKHYLNKFSNIAKDKATTMGHIKRKDLTDSLVSVPPDKIYQKADSILATLLDIQIKLNCQNIILQNLRGTLLPKLMSGEIRVPVEKP